MQKQFENVMLVGMASEIGKKYTYTSVRMAQDTIEPREPRLTLHTNQIMAYTFSHGTLDSVVQSTHLYVYPLLTLLAIPTDITSSLFV